MEYSNEIQNWLDKGNKITIGKTYYNRKQKREEKIRELKKELTNVTVSDDGKVISYKYVSSFPALIVNIIVKSWNYNPLKGFIYDWKIRNEQNKDPIITYLIGTGLLKLKRNKVQPSTFEWS